MERYLKALYEAFKGVYHCIFSWMESLIVTIDTCSGFHDLILTPQLLSGADETPSGASEHRDSY